MRLSMSLLATGTALLLCQSVATAQTNATATINPSAQASSTNSATTESLRAHMRDMLRNAGFSHVQMMPSSFVIRAQDQDGNPVVMSVSPDSVTEVSAVGGSNNNGSAGSSTPAETQSFRFVGVANNDDLSSNLIGLDVYNNANKTIGQIKDIALGPQGRTQAYIVSVGGFLGMDQHYIAVNPSIIKVSYSGTDNKWHASTNATTAELKSAPEFTYSGRWAASRS